MIPSRSHDAQVIAQDFAGHGGELAVHPLKGSFRRGFFPPPPTVCCGTSSRSRRRRRRCLCRVGMGLGDPSLVTGCFKPGRDRVQPRDTAGNHIPFIKGSFPPPCAAGDGKRDDGKATSLETFPSPTFWPGDHNSRNGLCWRLTDHCQPNASNRRTSSCCGLVEPGAWTL